MRISVSRRLALLAATEVLTVGLLLGVALACLIGVQSNVRFMRGFALPPVDTLGPALVENGHMLDAVALELGGGRKVDQSTLEDHLRSLEVIERRYRREWMVQGNPSHDAVRAERALASVGELALVDGEAVAVDRFGAALATLAVVVRAPDLPDRATKLQEALVRTQVELRALHNVSIAWLRELLVAVEADARRARVTLLVVGLLGVAIAGWEALRVREAIAPRIRRLVEKVQRFREIGVNERVLDRGCDEIAILANALEAGFTAIVERDRERERFLANAAHELKTPLASILGFAQAANAQPENVALGRRALDVIERRAARLTRVVEGVLLAARARSGDLSVQPDAMDLRECLRRVIREVEDSGAQRRFELDAPNAAPLVADAELVQHAIWTLVTYAVAVSVPDEPIRLEVVTSPARTSLRVSVCMTQKAREEIEHALTPFGAVIYEGACGARTGVGLFLCREIARVHGGALRLEEAPRGATLVLELPT